MGDIEQYHFMKRTGKKLDRILLLLETISEELNHMSVELDALEIQVAETRGIEESVIVLLNGINIQLDAIIAELAEAQVDNAKLVELRDSLDASEKALSLAVANFTPPIP